MIWRRSKQICTVSSDILTLSSEFEYSDDEDMTWKVRKASIAVLKAEVLAHPESDRVRSSIMPKLISRINEREENVRLSVMSALDQIIACHKEGMGEIP